MKTILYSVISIIIFISVSCKKEKTCGVFSQEDLQFLVYNEFDTVTFINQESELFRIYIDEFSFSETYTIEYRTLFGANEEACIEFVELLATNSNDTENYVFLKIEQSDMSDMQYFKYQLMDFNIEIDFDNEVPFINDFDYMNLVPDFSINGTIYDEVIRYIDITNSSKYIQTVYLNKSNGILKFIDEGTGVEWVLVD